MFAEAPDAFLWQHMEAANPKFLHKNSPYMWMSCKSPQIFWVNKYGIVAV